MSARDMIVVTALLWCVRRIKHKNVITHRNSLEARLAPARSALRSIRSQCRRLQSRRTSRMLTGSCLCKSIRFEISGTHSKVIVCHCSLCRKTSGSSSAAYIVIGYDELTWLSGQELVKSGPKHSFCRECGAHAPDSNPRKTHRASWTTIPSSQWASTSLWAPRPIGRCSVTMAHRDMKRGALALRRRATKSRSRARHWWMIPRRHHLRSSLVSSTGDSTIANQSSRAIGVDAARTSRPLLSCVT